MYCCTDNPPIYRKNVIRELVEAVGHQLLFLPKYSPDLNDIEHYFSALKKAIMYSPVNTYFDEIIRNYSAKYCFIFIENSYIAILWVVVAKFHTEKVLENQIFDHLQKI